MRIGKLSFRSFLAATSGAFLLASALQAGGVEQGGCTPQAAPRVAAGDSAPFDSFGQAVAISVDTMVVGSWNDETTTATGSAYVYDVLSGGATFLQKLTAPDLAAFDRFGWSVAVDADIIAVGSDRDDNVWIDAGSVYIYARSGSTYTFVTKVLATDAQPGDFLGASVSLSGNTLLVGAPGDDDLAANAGAAYVFVRSGSSWSQQVKLLAADGGADDGFGSAVALDGDRALVGAANHDLPRTDAGAAYPYVRSGAAWSRGDKLSAPTSQANDQFGFSVALRGTDALVGAPLSDVQRLDGGTAFAFQEIAGVWQFVNTLASPTGNNDDQFGISVALGNELALIGGYRDDAAGVDGGAVLLYVRSDSDWQFDQRISAPVSTGDLFGRAVAARGDLAAVGAPLDDVSSSNEGAAFLFELNCGSGGLPGDMNCDGAVTVSDIAGFVLALTDPAGYAVQFPACDINNGDINSDTVVSVSDIGPFVSLLTGG